MAREFSRRTLIAGGVNAAAGAALLAATTRNSSAHAIMRGAAGGTGGYLALTHVTLVDPVRPHPLVDATVLIRDRTIITVGAAADVAVPAGANVVDLDGKYLIPGLSEMHAHSYGTETISSNLFVANGVTSVREMAGSPAVSGWRDQIYAGTLVGPRWTIASTIIDGSPSLLVEPGDPEGAIAVSNEAEAREAVRRVKAEGADFVKVYSRLSPEAYAAIADESRRQGLVFAGHNPDLIPALDASWSGQRSIEHVHGIWFGATERESEVRAALAAIEQSPGDYAGWFRAIHPVEWMASSSYSPSKTEKLFDALVTNNTFVTPTLSMHVIVDRPEDVVVTDGRMKYVPAEAQEFWQWAHENIYLNGRGAGEIAEQRQLYDRRAEFTHAMHRAGVKLMAGSEAGFIYAYPGFSLHEELALLVRAGISPLDALRSATLTPAEFLGVSESLGSIEPGKFADLVVLDADPLADIANTTRINSVVLDGRYISPDDREIMLRDVAHAVAHENESDALRAFGCGCHMPRRAHRHA